ncbi:MAG: hypothetical protein ACOYJJ_09420 [Anaerovoracaceae bacterium]|jgi:hypothetical protein
MDNIGSELKKLGLLSAYNFLEKNPEENLPKLIDWLDTYMDENILKKQREVFREIVNEKNDSNWYQLIISVWKDYNSDVRKTMFENIIINAAAMAAPIAEENRKRYNCNIPWILSIELGDSEKDGSLDFDEWDSVITQAKRRGTFMFIIMGEDPLHTKEEIIALCNKHADCEFLLVTDGQRFDEDFAMEMLRVRNIIVAFKVNSLEQEKMIDEPAAILRACGLPYVISCLYDKTNQEELDTEEFFDSLIDKGVKLGFFLSRLSDEDDEIYKKILKYRNRKKFMAIHFCKDKVLIGGCVAGGRYYASINSQGDVEPCFFVNRSDANLRNLSLIDAYRRPLFQSYRVPEIECDALER